MFWYLIAGIDDSESIQLNQHRNPELWDFLRTLTKLCDDSELMNPSPALHTLGLNTNQFSRSYQTCGVLDSNHKLLLRKD